MRLADSGAARRTVFASAEQQFEWIDVVAPDRVTLHTLARDYGLPDSAGEACLDPRALPKHERHGECVFMILRAHIDPVPESAASAYELTQPMAIYAGPRFVITIHRRDHRRLARLRDQYAASGATLERPSLSIMLDVIGEVFLTYDAPLDQLSIDLEQLEASLLRGRLTEGALEQIFIRKRRASALAWLLLRTREVLLRISPAGDRSLPLLQELRETADVLHFRARELVDYTDNLLSLQIAIASHRTNEVMRVLTLMSVVFMPLTFIVGVYGMNFAMPEFRWRHGYLLAYAMIVGVLVGVVAWFHRRGWLR